MFAWKFMLKEMSNDYSTKKKKENWKNNIVFNQRILLLKEKKIEKKY